MHVKPEWLPWIACLFCCGQSTFAPTEAQAASLTRTNLLQYVSGSSGELRAVRTTLEWEHRRRAILTAMQEVMGPLPGIEKRGALQPRVIEETDCGTYVRRLIEYHAEPGSRVPAYLLVPKAAFARKAPALLALHQTHALGQKVVVGLGNSPDDEYGVELVKRGFIVLAPPYPLLAEYNPPLTQLGYVSASMKAIWDNMRGLDYLETLPFVKTNGFGAIGHSLGGHNALFTAAFDQRIKAIVSSCGFDSFQDYKDGNIKGWTGLRYMPNLSKYSMAELPFDFSEIIGALAPRSLFVSAPTGDHNFKWRSVDAVVATAKPVYELYGASEKLQVRHPDCKHSFAPEMRQAAYEVLENVLKR